MHIRSKKQCFDPVSRPRCPSAIGTLELQLSSSCKSDKISSMFSSFDTQKANILKSVGFGDILNLPLLERQVNLQLCLWLLQRYDCTNRCLRFDGGVLHVRAPDVHLVFGIPYQGEPVSYTRSQSQATIRAFNDKLAKGSSYPSLTISCLEHILTKEYPSHMSPDEVDTFIIAAVLYVATYLLGPEPKNHFPMELIKNFVSEVKPAQLNWADFVLNTLDRAADEARLQYNVRSNKMSLFGSCLFLQVFYLDNLNFGPSTPLHSFLPRASAYWPGLMNEMIASDSTRAVHNGLTQFGNIELRPAHEVCYTRAWQYHLNMVDDLDQICQNDQLTCTAIISQRIQLLREIAAQSDQTSQSTEYAMQGLTNGTKTSYATSQSKFNDVFHNLSRRAADFVQTSNISLYQHSTTQHAIPNEPTTKRSKSFVQVAQHEDTPTSSLNGQPISFLTDISAQALRQASSQLDCFNRKIVRRHSNFPISPFDLNFNHPDVDSTDKSKTYKWMTDESMPWDVLQRDWIVFPVPTELSIPGHVIRTCLKQKGMFTVGLVDAIMLLWSYLDRVVYKHHQNHGHTHKQWRHFLPATFAEIVHDRNDYLNSNEVRANFLGEHITYDVQDCQKIIIPYFGDDGTWCCYFWDLKYKKIEVLDPVLMKGCPTKAQRKHRSFVWRLHRALLDCIDHFFLGWNIQHDDWDDIYITDAGPRAKPENSGLHVVHYARAFTGAQISFELREPNESSLADARGEIAYLMFACTDNIGFKPKDLMAQINIPECSKAHKYSFRS